MTARWVDHFAVGIHSARPAASAVPKGAFYSCTTHGLIYQSDGSSTWSTWATLGSTGSGLVAVTEGSTPSSPGAGTQTLFLDSADHKLKRVNSSGVVVTIEGGGSSSAWTDTIIAALQTALTGWTAGAGTWTAEVDRFRLNSSATTAAMRLFYNTKVPVSVVDLQVEIRIDASNASASSRAGIVFGGPATDAGGGLLVALATTGSTTQTNTVHTEVDAVANLKDFTLGSAINHSTWMTLKLVKSGAALDVYLNGTLIWSTLLLGTSAGGVVSPIDMRRFALVGFGVDASFRNLKYRTLTPAA